jgi:hypothetical protein
MTAKFSIDVEPNRDLVRITMSGFFQHADIAEFVEARRIAHQALRCAPNAHLTKSR